MWLKIHATHISMILILGENFCNIHQNETIESIFVIRTSLLNLK